MPMCTLHMHFDQPKCTCFLPTSWTLNFLLILGRKLSSRNYIFYSVFVPTKHPYSLLYFNCFDFWDYESKPTFVFYVETKMPLIFTIYSTYKYNFYYVPTDLLWSSNTFCFVLLFSQHNKYVKCMASMTSKSLEV